VLQKVIANKMVLGPVMVSTQDFDENRELWAISRMSGGIACRPRDEAPESDLLELFEQEAFLNFNLRKRRQARSSASVDAISQMIRKVSKESWDKERENRQLKEARSAFALAVPLYAVRKEMLNATRERRSARILRELKYIIKHISPDMIVYVNSEQIEKIRVFFRGLPGSPFTDRFWSVYIAFPDQYPSRTPILRFTNIPRHPNISAEGIVRFTMLEGGQGHHDTVRDHRAFKDDPG
jgi:hypothetical protein